jgi:hypothetical protein
MRFLSQHYFMQIKESICYTKSLIASLAAEHSESHVHVNRIMPILRRVLRLKLRGSEPFFRLRQRSNDIIDLFFHMVAQSGEIFHLGGGYYIVPPARHVLLPNSGQKIAISLNQGSMIFSPGQIGQISDLPLPCINLEDWAYAESPANLLERYERKLYDEPNFKPKQWFYVSSSGLRHVQNPTIFRADPEKTYLLTYKPYKQADVRLWYLGRKITKYWRIYQVDKEHIRRIIMGLEFRQGIRSNYQIISHDDQYIMLRISRVIPIEEQIMLALIGLPESWPDPRMYLIPMEYLEDAKAILERLHMSEEDNYGV